MENPEVLARMRADWNQRAGEDANYYVAFGRREQDQEEFFATGADVVKGLAAELKRFPGRDAALEIGCGPGRLLRPMSRHFAEIHGVDVSDEMIRLAAERLSDTPNAHAHHNSGSDLMLFAGDRFDFVYSYAVFQHIPSREVVFQYLREARRVLKPGGVLRCQINGLPAHAKQYDTWSGVRIAPEELAGFTRANDLQLLALEQPGTQYMWMTCRKRERGWVASLAGREPAGGTVIRRISNALTSEAASPASGPSAALTLLMERLPEECDLNHMAVTADGQNCRVAYIGPAERGTCQVNVMLPQGIRTGLVAVEASWLGRPLCAPGWVRIIPAGPLVPRVKAVSDGINLLSDSRIVTRSVKVTMSEVAHSHEFRATVAGQEALDVESFCTDPLMQRYEFNFRLPASVGTGRHELRIRMGKREFAPLAIEVA
jgi:SAM-dependent methyltransferase